MAAASAGRKSHAFCCALFLLYLASLIYLLFLSQMREVTYNNINLTPFKTIRMLFEYYFVYHQFSFWYWFSNFFGNMFLLAPFGFLLPIVLKRRMHPAAILCSSGLFSLLIEACQFAFQVGEADVDDLILNVVGALIGYAIFRFCLFIHTRKVKRRIS